MNEEEAIEKIKLSIQINNATKEINGDNTSINVQVLETVLNLLEKKDRQIEQYQNMLATNDMLHVLESQKKDKQIDLMSNYICCMAYDKIIKKLKEDDIAYYGIEGSIKQYFERKVEE